jgi:hypothetical protein
VHYPPGAFGQSNLDVAERIVEVLRDQSPNARVCRVLCRCRRHWTLAAATRRTDSPERGEPPSLQAWPSVSPASILSREKKLQVIAAGESKRAGAEGPTS